MKFHETKPENLARAENKCRKHCPEETVMEDEDFLARFEAAAFPIDEWHHREHIKAAYLYLCRYPFEIALERMRASIQALNAAHHVPESPTRGYHETTTQAWLRLVHTTLCEYGASVNADQFYEEHPELSQKKLLRLFYSRELLQSPRLKGEFVEPDLATLPKAKGLARMDSKPRRITA